MLSKNGIAPNPKRVKAIVEMPPPINVSQLRSFVGMILYYAKFLSHFAIKMKPFYELLKKGEKWNWSDECERCFVECKKLILSAKILIHYDPNKPIVMVCDASNTGISAILCHVVNNEEQPIFFASRVLTNAEMKYPILHREALAIVFGLEKFYKYVFGHKITVKSDHKPLEGIFNKHTPYKHGVVASRLQRYLNRVSHFDFTVEHRKGKENCNADCLSRLPIKKELSTEDSKEEKLAINGIEQKGEVYLNIELIARETEKDPLLRALKSFIQNGWPSGGIERKYKAFYSLNENLTVVQECIMNGERIVIPDVLKEKVLNLLHTNHSGIVRMKQLARKHVFWLGINEQIDEFVSTCESCQMYKSDKRNKIYGEWPKVTFPFERVHIDFMEYKGNKFLIFIDVFSRWIDVKLMNKTTACNLIEKLEDIFGYFGYCKKLVSDNGPPFGSYEFKEYCKRKGIELMHSPPYNPNSNGIVERAVQTIKRILMKLVYDAKLNGQSYKIKSMVKTLLRNQRNLPTTKDQIIPNSRIFSYKPKWDLDAIKPEISKTKSILRESKNLSEKNPKIDNKNSKHVKFNLKTKDRKIQDEKNEIKRILTLKVGDKIWYIHKQQGKLNRYKGIVTEKISELRYRVNIDGNVRICHINQLEKRIIKQKPIFHELERDNPISHNPQKDSKSDKTVTNNNADNQTVTPKISRPRRERKQSSFDEEQRKERPSRERNKPNWYNPSYWLQKQ